MRTHDVCRPPRRPGSARPTGRPSRHTGRVDDVNTISVPMNVEDASGSSAQHGGSVAVEAVACATRGAASRRNMDVGVNLERLRSGLNRW